jgi:hypothetical protein
VTRSTGDKIFQTGGANATQYSINYTVYEDEAELKDFFNATLSIQDFNISSWNTTDGTQGLWLGLSYGSKIRNNSDSTVCRYDFTNATSDVF